MIDTHSKRVLDPLEMDAKHLAEAFKESDPVFTEVTLRALRLYALVLPSNLASITKGHWAVASLADELRQAS